MLLNAGECDTYVCKFFKTMHSFVQTLFCYFELSLTVDEIYPELHYRGIAEPLMFA